MTSLTSIINVNVDSNLKSEANKVLNDLGLNMSTAINIYLTQIVKKNGIPFEITNPKPSAMLLEALEEIKNMEHGKIKTNSYSTKEELKKALLSDD